jgi:putative transposase
MCTWSHYKFRQFILHKQKEFPWCNVVITNESYTSKTCGNCGIINDKLGSSKTFKCNNDKCRSEFDRDINGSRNILIKYLTEKKINF